MTIHVIAMPGGVNPAEVRYSPVQAALGDDVKLHWKDLEVYAGDEPPAGYSIQMEVDALARFADSLGLERFHLLGYSGGGFISLAFAGAYPDRLPSLALFEPASIPGPLSHAERVLWDRIDDGLRGTDGEEFMRGFMTLQVRPGVDVQPPQGPPPPWMAKRPAGIRAFLTTFKSYPLDRKALAGFRQPVYFALGGLSNPDEYGEIAKRLDGVFPDFTLEIFPERHHFDPPHRIEPERLATSLLRIWTRAEAAPQFTAPAAAG